PPHKVRDRANAVALLLERHRARDRDVTRVALPFGQIFESITAIGALRDLADLLVGEQYFEGFHLRLKPVLAIASRSTKSSSVLGGGVSFPSVSGRSSARSI